MLRTSAPMSGKSSVDVEEKSGLELLEKGASRLALAWTSASPSPQQEDPQQRHMLYGAEQCHQNTAHFLPLTS